MYTSHGRPDHCAARVISQNVMHSFEKTLIEQMAFLCFFESEINILHDIKLKIAENIVIE